MLSTRARLVALAAATIALGAAFAAIVVARSGNDDGPAAIVEDLDAPRGQTPFKGALRPLAPPRDFVLRNQDGRLIRTRDLRGKVVVVTPMYTTCRDTCPLVAQQIRDSFSDLPPGESNRVIALAVSVDPANDTRDSAKRFLKTRRVGGFIDFLIGSESALRPVWKDYGFSPQTDSQEHNAYVVLLDTRGRQRVGFPVDFLTPESLTHDIRLLIERPPASRAPKARHTAPVS